MSEVTLAQLVETHRTLGEQVCARLNQEIDKLGFGTEQGVRRADYDDVQFSIIVDPYGGGQDLVGHWFDAQHSKIGGLQFHAGGTFFAEFDVVRSHPRKPQFFVESVTAWGSPVAIKSEAKLLDAL